MRTLGLAVLLFLAAAPAPAWTISAASSDPTPLAAGPGASELSGITWAGGDRYYAVSDDLPRLFRLAVAIAPSSGAIVSARVEHAVPLASGSDLEGVAYDRSKGAVFVTDEEGPMLREYSVADGGILRRVPLPRVFYRYRTNLSLESVSLAPGRDCLWIANEEALKGDGPISSTTAGTRVRLQKFDASLEPVGQWAYVTDPIPGELGDTGRHLEASGVSDLLALPDGGLLVLERAFGTAPFGFRIRIYAVDFRGATDVSRLPSLKGGDFAPVQKSLLWEGRFALDNFEGMALGPRLSGGAYSVLLVSDDGSGMRQDLYALRLAPSRQ